MLDENHLALKALAQLVAVLDCRGWGEHLNRSGRQVLLATLVPMDRLQEGLVEKDRRDGLVAMDHPRGSQNHRQESLDAMVVMEAMDHPRARQVVMDHPEDDVEAMDHPLEGSEEMDHPLALQAPLASRALLAPQASQASRALQSPQAPQAPRASRAPQAPQASRALPAPLAPLESWSLLDRQAPLAFQAPVDQQAPLLDPLALHRRHIIDRPPLRRTSVQGHQGQGLHAGTREPRTLR